MAKMVRKQVYIHEEQDKELKRLSKTFRVAEADLIREGIDTSLQRGNTYMKSLEAWEEWKMSAMAGPETNTRKYDFGTGRSKKAKTARSDKSKAGRGWTRDELYDRGKDSD